MNVLDVQTSVICQTGTQTRRIQNGTGTDDLLGVQTGYANCFIGQHVNRIADYEITCVGSILHDLRHYGSHDLCIGLAQIDTGLTRLSGNTNGDDDHIGICCVRIITVVNIAGRAECITLHNVHSLALCLGLVDVDQQQFRAKTFDCQSKCDRRTNISGTENGNFLSFFQLLFHFRIPPKTLSRTILP